MKRHLSMFLVSISCLILAAPSTRAQSGGAMPGVSALSEQAVDEPLRQRLEEIEARLNAIAHMRGKFRQTRQIPMLRQPMKSTGTVLLRDGAIRWDTLEPAASTMLVQADEIRLYYPDSAILEIYQSGRADVPLQARGARPAVGQLYEWFSIREIPASSFGGVPDTDQLGLELLPHEESVDAQVESVQVLIDTAIPMIRRIRITSKEGEGTEIELFDLRSDRPIRESEMEIQVPEGTLISRPLGGDLERARENEAVGHPVVTDGESGDSP